METLKKDPYQWSLFMQAMRNIQQKGYKPTPASWQEIGTPSLYSHCTCLAHVYQAAFTVFRTADGGTSYRRTSRYSRLSTMLCSGDPNGPSQPDDNIYPDPDHPGQQKLQWQGEYQNTCVI